jgi:hypothetical protein
MSDSGTPELLRRSTRRSFLGLGGGLALALAGGSSALAAAAPSAATSFAGSSSPAGVARGCLGGKDPGEQAAATRVKAARLGAAGAGPGHAGAPALDQRRGRFGRTRYLSRAQWGADESLRFDAAGNEVWPPTYWPVQTFTVHHTADGSTDPDNAARLRSIYRYQAVDEAWGDLGYQFMIDDAGVIYEGRYSGADGLPGFDANGLMVNGAHVAGYNAGNVGIALIGDFTSTLPTAPAYRTLVLLLAGLAAWQGIDPLARVNYVNPISAVTADVPAIAGHRDWAATQCPGNTFAPTLGQLREDVVAAQGH